MRATMSIVAKELFVLSRISVHFVDVEKIMSPSITTLPVAAYVSLFETIYWHSFHIPLTDLNFITFIVTNS